MLILFPKLAINLLAEEELHHINGRVPRANQSVHDLHKDIGVEVYFARSLGFALMILVLIALLFTGTIPITKTASEPISLEENDPKAPYASPILMVTTLFHTMSSIYCYARYLNTSQTGFLLGLLGYGGLSLAGGWSVLFGFTSRVSARTGEDKRTSGFLFPNTSAYDKKADKKLK